ncbi:unnamed protein product [Pneumocystis jirovecii]|uniref:Cytochrome b-c1 complex subunit 8 n=1 Tax=Pneumocystis jirovecii TaxID=42068 RepID=L0PDG9_PNEJI|nr:unnamed protein product [Pneumocystis jirovecii]
MPNSDARLTRSSRTFDETTSRWVISSAASNCATIDFKTSFPIDGSTRRRKLLFGNKLDRFLEASLHLDGIIRAALMKPSANPCFLLSLQYFVAVHDGLKKLEKTQEKNTFVLTSYIIARWSHGIRKCVPSPITSFLIPTNRSKRTAASSVFSIQKLFLPRYPPLTSYIEACPTASAKPIGRPFFTLPLSRDCHVVLLFELDFLICNEACFIKTVLIMAGDAGKKYSKEVGWWGNMGGPVQKGIITYSLSPRSQHPLAGMLHSAVFNTYRRCCQQILYFGVPLMAGYSIYVWAVRRNEYLYSKAGQEELKSLTDPDGGHDGRIALDFLNLNLIVSGLNTPFSTRNVFFWFILAALIMLGTRMPQQSPQALLHFIGSVSL